jgi:DNA-binding response OmpR family regulator
MRRTHRDGVIRAADLVVNTATREVRWGRRNTELTAREYELLEFMARNYRRVLSRDPLLSRVRGQEFRMNQDGFDD